MRLYGTRISGNSCATRNTRTFNHPVNANHGSAERAPKYVVGFLKLATTDRRRGRPFNRFRRRQTVGAR